MVDTVASVISDDIWSDKYQINKKVINILKIVRSK